MWQSGPGTFRALVAVFLLGVAGIAAAQLSVPPLTARVVDQTGTLSAAQKDTLDQSLAAFEAKKGTQIAVLMVASTAPEAIEPFALRVAERWKLGRKKVDDGAILIVAKDDRALRIEVGYGLEGALNDATSKRIIEETIVPRFKQQDYFGGVSAGVEQMMRVVDGEPLPAPKAAPAQQRDAAGGLQQYAPILFVVALAAGGLLRAMLGRFPGALVTGGVVGVVAWFMAGALSIALVAGVIALFVTLLGGGLGGLGRSLGGGYYGGGGRGGGGGGFGGGGFSGGGGGFGGGGASGKW